MVLTVGLRCGLGGQYLLQASLGYILVVYPLSSQQHTLISLLRAWRRTVRDSLNSNGLILTSFISHIYPVIQYIHMMADCVGSTQLILLEGES